VDSPLAASPADSASGDSFEARRARWAAAGLADDQRLERQAIAVAILLTCGFIAAFAVVLYIG
jgi:hypothetical protein